MELCRIALASPEITARLGEQFARLLGPGDVLLLAGPIGSGKTHFARALIQSRLAADGAPVEDVPSPTFTLVQAYLTPEVEIWHADLYRLAHPDEVEELGLTSAFASAICLVEWPDRLGDLAPASALTLEFAMGDAPGTRHLTLLGDAATWRARTDTVSAELAHAV